MQSTAPTNLQLQLFPHLPPELRNTIYHFTTTTTTTTSPTMTTNLNLPFTTKTYTTSHTTLTLTPVHTGNPSLLALALTRPATILEAQEYATYILTHATKLHITLAFHGHANTFVQRDWDKKVSAQLGKLVRKYAWVGRVKDVDVEVVWRPRVESLRRVRGGVVGGILEGMVRTVLVGVRGQEQEVKGMGMGMGMGTVRVSVGVDRGTVNAGRCWGLELGIERVLRGYWGYGRVVTEVWVDGGGEGKEVGVGKGLVVVERGERDEQRRLVVRRVVEGKEEWLEGVEGGECKEQMWVRSEILRALELEGSAVREMRIVEH